MGFQYRRDGLLIGTSFASLTNNQGEDGSGAVMEVRVVGRRGGGTLG